MLLFAVKTDWSSLVWFVCLSGLFVPIHMTLMMTFTQVVETSVNVTNNSPSRDYSHPDDQTTQTTETPGFKSFTTFHVITSCSFQLGCYGDVHAEPITQRRLIELGIHCTVL